MGATGKGAEHAQPPRETSEAAISSVLGDDDILREILLRLDFPTCLVRAAAVSKRWLRHASDPAFLRRFRRHHPPRLLGFFVFTKGSPLRFVPRPQPPELAAVIRRGSFDLGKGAGILSNCRNGRLIVFTMPEDGTPGRKTVCSPLHPGRGTAAIPWPPFPVPGHGGLKPLHSIAFMFHEDGGDGMSCTAVTVMGDERRAWIQLSDLQAGAWGEGRNSDLILLQGKWKTCKNFALLAYGQLYMICMAQYILRLDVTSMSAFCIKLPDGVEYEYDANLALSCAEGSGFCLIHVRKFQIHVWRYTTDCRSTGNWKLIDTICLHQAFGHLADPTWRSQGAVVRVAAVGDNADFVFLWIQYKVFYVHISSRKVEKVYEPAREHECLLRVCPFMMVWPPTFPALNGGHDQDE